MLNICFSSSACVMIKMELDQNTLFLLDDLSVGHINNQNYEGRFEEFFSMYGYRIQDKQKERNLFLQNYQTLIEEIGQNDVVRIWYSNSPSEYFGMLYLCSIIDYTKKVYLTNCSDYVKDCIAVSLLEDYELTKCSQHYKILNQKELQAYKETWEQLVQENSKLRVYENGRIITSEAYYDKDIKELLSKKMSPLNISTEIYLVYLRKRMLVSDGYIYVRINQLVMGTLS
ncbi:DUF1835 domain-containing protein [Enterocloster bolteae]|jgi:hypothetical protein|uniref:DUF1835 domain-containing protein n=1 Tax=Enterocloster bolteae TaxID=208479 RepID=UPI0006C7D736|nr:DUF1835 domain-containing protein [Enterocloster bolteae]